MRNRKTLQILFLLVLAAVLAGCGTTSATVKPFTAMNAKEKSVYFMGFYKAQFKDAESMGALAQAGKLSPGQIEIYRAKRALLIKAKPAIEMYDAIVAGGGLPGVDREQEILNMLNQLAALGG